MTKRPSSASSYDRGFYEHQKEDSRESARRVVPLILELFPGRSVLDVGCGLGTWLSVFRELGVDDVVGIDGDYVDPNSLYVDRALFLGHDLATPLELNRRFDLVMSLEVGEHLPESAADTFVESLVRHGDVIVFSAAIPGQFGVNHVNEQWPSYWVRKFATHSYEAWDLFRPVIWDDPSVALCYKQNIVVFTRNLPPEQRQLLADRAKDRPVLDSVHPEHYEHVMTVTASAGRILAHVPPLYRLGEKALVATRALTHRGG